MWSSVPEADLGYINNPNASIISVDFIDPPTMLFRKLPPQSSWPVPYTMPLMTTLLILIP